MSRDNSESRSENQGQKPDTTETSSVATTIQSAVSELGDPSSTISEKCSSSKNPEIGRHMDVDKTVSILPNTRPPLMITPEISRTLNNIYHYFRLHILLC